MDKTKELLCGQNKKGAQKQHMEGEKQIQRQHLERRKLRRCKATKLLPILKKIQANSKCCQQIFKE